MPPRVKRTPHAGRRKPAISATEQSGQPTIKQQGRHPRSWHLVLAALAGVLRNTLRFEYDIPTGPNETTHRKKSMTDTGWGAGLTAVFFYKKLSITNVSFLVPDVNSSLVTGNVLSAVHTLPIRRWISFDRTLGIAYHYVSSDLRNYEDTVTKGGVSATAHFDRFLVNNHIVEPYVRMGVRFHIPIQHWYVTAHAGYLLEAVRVNVSSPGGRVYIPQPIDDTKTIPPLKVHNWTYYERVQVGGSLFMDFHYGLQLRIMADYDLTYSKFSIRAMGAAFFSRRIPVGLTVYFEYSQGIVHDNLFIFFGPAYMF